MDKEELKKLIEDLNTAVTASRERSEKLEKNLDGLDLEAMKKWDKEISDISEKISNMKVAEINQEKIDAEIKDLKEQQAILAAATGEKVTDTTVEEKDAESMKHFNGMLRKSENYTGYSKHQPDVISALVAEEFKYSDEAESERVEKDLLVGSNPDGGYLVPTRYGMVIMGQIYETSPIRAHANRQAINGTEIEFPLDDQQADAGWVGETEDRPDTATPQMAVLRIPVHELYASPKATQKLLEDSGINISMWLAMKVARRFGRVENTAFVSGDGSLRPRGFLDYPEWDTANVYQRDAIERVNSGVAADFNGDSFKSLCGALKQEYMMGAIWGMKRAVWTEVTKLKDSEDRYLFDMQRNFREGDTMEILGKPVVLMDDMPVKGANSNSVVFGNFKEGYTIVDRIGIRVLRDAYTAKPFVKFYTTKRVGGAVTNYESLKIMKLAA